MLRALHNRAIRGRRMKYSITTTGTLGNTNMLHSNSHALQFVTHATIILHCTTHHNTLANFKIHSENMSASCQTQIASTFGRRNTNFIATLTTTPVQLKNTYHWNVQAPRATWNSKQLIRSVSSVFPSSASDLNITAYTISMPKWNNKSCNIKYIKTSCGHAMLVFIVHNIVLSFKAVLCVELPPDTPYFGTHRSEREKILSQYSLLPSTYSLYHEMNNNILPHVSLVLTYSVYIKIIFD